MLALHHAWGALSSKNGVNLPGFPWVSDSFVFLFLLSRPFWLPGQLDVSLLADFFGAEPEGADVCAIAHRHLMAPREWSSFLLVAA